jgi:hypothetical protein
MQIKISHSGKSEWLKQNLEDFVWSLDRVLRREKKGLATGEFSKTELVVSVEKAGIEYIKPFVDAFERSMRKGGDKMFVNLSI